MNIFNDKKCWGSEREKVWNVSLILYCVLYGDAGLKGEDRVKSEYGKLKLNDFDFLSFACFSRPLKAVLPYFLYGDTQNLREFHTSSLKKFLSTLSSHFEALP